MTEMYGNESLEFGALNIFIFLPHKPEWEMESRLEHDRDNKNKQRR